MLKKLLKIFSNPLIYYVDKSGNSVFRNYCLLKQTGCLYQPTLPKANAGKTIEYHLELDKYLKRIYFLTPIILYFIFIHTKFSICNLLLFEFLWLFIVNIARIYASKLFSIHLIKNFGKYESVEFTPPIGPGKTKEYIQLYLSKIVAIIVVIGIFCIPAPLIRLLIKYDITVKPRFSQAIALSEIYFSLYPKSEKIYDMRAYAKYKKKDLEGSLADYITVLDLSGKKFSKKDITRLANILYLKKLLSNPNDAVDLFNEYSTKKNLSVLETSQLLWIKSIFKIENNLDDTIIQDYNDMLESLDAEDMQNRFYITSDKAYILYLMKSYVLALETYNNAISYAENAKGYTKELQSLYAERGFVKRQLGDEEGANADFIASGIKPSDIMKFEPYFTTQEFLVEKF